MKKNIGLWVLVVVLAFVIGGIGGYYAYDKIQDIEENNNNELDNDLFDTDSDEVSIKLDDTKDYVYDASYEYASKYNSIFAYTDEVEDDNTNCSDVSKSNDIVIGNGYISAAVIESHVGCFSSLIAPYININSSDATEANNSIKELYLEYAKMFDEGIDDKLNGWINVGRTLLTYNYYQYEDILSVFIISGGQITAPWSYDLTTYNFDLTTGKLLSYSEVLDKLGYNADAVIEKAHNIINEQIGSYATSDVLTKTYSFFDERVSNNTIAFIVDNDGLLNIAVNVGYYVYEPANDHIYTISK